MDTKQIEVSSTQEVEIIEDTKNNKFKNKKIYIIGAICTVALVGAVLTTALIPKKGKEEKNDIDDSHLSVQVGEQYEGLNYERQKETIVKEGFFYNYTKNQEGSKVDVSFLKVDGLIDNSLENMINTTLKVACESMYNGNNLSDPNVLYDHISNCTDVYIFNNVLSTLYKREFSDVEGNTKTEYYAINVNLKDNKEFTLKDVFRDNTDLSKIISNYNDDIVFCVSPKFVY